MKRIEDYNKVLPVLEVYRCVQSEGSRFGRPTIAVRTTGCTHRCYFGEGGWCDSWYTSIHPEKGRYTWEDVHKIYDDNPHVSEMMLTGGSPTMHPALVNEITHFAKERGILVTIETEGSHFLETDYPLDLISPVDWTDETQNINDRVRSYLDVNCGHCHSPTGNANSTGLYLHLNETRDIHLGVNKKPVATGRGSGGMKYSIVPGKPEESILLHRMISLDPGVMMPESGRALSHTEAVDMVRSWILLMKE